MFEIANFFNGLWMYSFQITSKSPISSLNARYLLSSLDTFFRNRPFTIHNSFVDSFGIIIRWEISFGLIDHTVVSHYGTQFSQRVLYKSHPVWVDWVHWTNPVTITVGRFPFLLFKGTATLAFFFYLESEKRWPFLLHFSYFLAFLYCWPFRVKASFQYVAQSV